MIESPAQRGRPAYVRSHPRWIDHYRSIDRWVGQYRCSNRTHAVTILTQRSIDPFTASTNCRSIDRSITASSLHCRQLQVVSCSKPSIGVQGARQISNSELLLYYRQDASLHLRLSRIVWDSYRGSNARLVECVWIDLRPIYLRPRPARPDDGRRSISSISFAVPNTIEVITVLEKQSETFNHRAHGNNNYSKKGWRLFNEKRKEKKKEGTPLVLELIKFSIRITSPYLNTINYSISCPRTTSNSKM